jgi:hypothetical protein
MLQMIQYVWWPIMFVTKGSYFVDCLMALCFTANSVVLVWDHDHDLLAVGRSYQLN